MEILEYIKEMVSPGNKWGLKNVEKTFEDFNVELSTINMDEVLKRVAEGELFTNVMIEKCYKKIIEEITSERPEIVEKSFYLQINDLDSKLYYKNKWVTSIEDIIEYYYEWLTTEQIKKQIPYTFKEIKENDILIGLKKENLSFVKLIVVEKTEEDYKINLIITEDIVNYKEGKDITNATEIKTNGNEDTIETKDYKIYTNINSAKKDLEKKLNKIIEP